MPNLDLPFLRLDAKADVALDLMRHRSKSGVVGHSGGRYWLFAAWQVVIALSDSPSVTLMELKPLQELHLTRNSRTFDAAEDSGHRISLVGSLQEDIASHFGIDRATFTMLEGSPLDCYCRVDGKPVSGGQTGTDCPDGHHNSVRCV